MDRDPSSWRVSFKHVIQLQWRASSGSLVAGGGTGEIDRGKRDHEWIAAPRCSPVLIYLHPLLHQAMDKLPAFCFCVIAVLWIKITCIVRPIIHDAVKWIPAAIWQLISLNSAVCSPG